MNLTKENVKKICGIILFTVVVLVIVQNYEKVGNAIGILWGIIFPFVLGGTTLLIVVQVTMDFITQVQSHLIAYQYEGLLKKASLVSKRKK